MPPAKTRGERSKDQFFFYLRVAIMKVNGWHSKKVLDIQVHERAQFVIDVVLYRHLVNANSRTGDLHENRDVFTFTI
jgi:hypothetical protein